jgi:hypothetical protein
LREPVAFVQQLHGMAHGLLGKVELAASHRARPVQHQADVDGRPLGPARARRRRDGDNEVTDNSAVSRHQRAIGLYVHVTQDRLAV